jgi:hypothetical protein
MRHVPPLREKLFQRVRHRGDFDVPVSIEQSGIIR